MELNEQDNPCSHESYHDRGFHTTLNSIDLIGALEIGYLVPRCYQIYDWGKSETRHDLFQDMIKVINDSADLRA